ncbi:hypothetical protein B5M47_01595 [candidate division CPR3 bacterium 4484_211]|uniref:Glycosyltransferase 2-like domain-containing protein n=1 Tax=candidate division CPR3 bacterium 4484_211 TaxID=1968527 RepID=A0A1W9NYZ4_UNCC3|nr:MAG: hypothetical protein B5M47_01595 [candidate division CPR3 bacterium 4484_211]
MPLKKPTDKTNPLISLITPAYNEESYIAECLTSIFNQSVEFPYEVIVVDGKSTDGTIKIVKSFQKVHSNLVLLENPRRFTPFALNLALKYARGEFIARVDAHSYIPRHYLETCLKTFRQAQKEYPRLAGVGGRWKCGNKSSLGRAIFYATNSWFGGGISKYRYSSKPQLVKTVLYGFYKREVLEKEGFADEKFIKAQDAELNWRLVRAGYKLFYNPAIYSYYHAPNSLRKLARQMFTYGRARGQVLQKHPSSLNPLSLLAPLLVVYIFFLPAFLRLQFLITPLFFYLCLGILFSLKICLKKKALPQLFPTLAAFWVTHFFFGLGMIVQFLYHQP